MSEVVTPSKDYTFLNKFQSDFYTSVENFNQYTNWDIKNNGFTLICNLYKGFPVLADEILNYYSPPFIIGFQSPAILRALQRVRFVNGFTRPRNPNYLYYKQSTKKAKIIDTTSRKKPKGCEDFESDVAHQLMSLLFMDRKTYDYLKYTEKVQKLGKHLISEQTQKEAAEYLKAINKNK
jgi:hypothetical protein